MINNIKEKGITLIALVVTIIILLILAGVTIGFAVNGNGLFEKATEATEKYAQKAREEESSLNEWLEVIEEYTGESNIETIASKKTTTGNPVTILSQTDITTLKDDNGKRVKIPPKFGIASDSATVVSDGIVIEDANGNQFVWIPVDNISNYTRSAFGFNILTNETDSTTNSKKILFAEEMDYFIEAMPSDEQTSININKGYYIGRYEAGDSTIPTATGNSLRNSNVSNSVVVKKGYAPYNYITKANSITKAEAMKTEQNYAGTTKTKLCSSYAWDTAINFIQSKGGNLATYGSDSQQGNHRNTTFSYTDITNANQTKATSSDELVPTGQTTPVCNIYDMGGNVWEWTTENAISTHTSTEGNTEVARGGVYGFDSDFRPAGIRINISEADGVSAAVGFRVALFL